MKIPLIDLVAQYHVIREEIDRVIHEVLERGTFILGPKVAAFEEAISSYLGVKHAVGVASGTDALLLTFRAYGIGPGHEVIVPAYTFFATAEAVSQCGATPVFVDIDPKTYCIDVAQIESRITPRTKAIIPVHLYGHPADMAAIMEVAEKRGRHAALGKAGSSHPDRLGGSTEGGVLAWSTMRHPTGRDRVGRNGAERMEHAGGDADELHPHRSAPRESLIRESSETAWRRETSSSPLRRWGCGSESNTCIAGVLP